MEAVFHKMTKHTLQDSTGAKVRHTFIFEERERGKEGKGEGTEGELISILPPSIGT